MTITIERGLEPILTEELPLPEKSNDRLKNGIIRNIGGITGVAYGAIWPAVSTFYIINEHFQRFYDSYCSGWLDTAMGYCFKAPSQIVDSVVTGVFTQPGFNWELARVGGYLGMCFFVGDFVQTTTRAITKKVKNRSNCS